MPVNLEFELGTATATDRVLATVASVGAIESALAADSGALSAEPVVDRTGGKDEFNGAATPWVTAGATEAEANHFIPNFTLTAINPSTSNPITMRLCGEDLRDAADGRLDAIACENIPVVVEAGPTLSPDLTVAGPRGGTLGAAGAKD